MLKHTLSLVLLLLAAAPVLAQGRLAFEATTHDFGPVAEGEEATYTFAFTNTGDAELRLVEVRPSCGCTTPSYTTEAVAPGAQGEVVVAYDSQGRPGPFRKTIRVAAQSGSERLTEVLTITGEVVPETIEGGVTQGSVRFETDVYDLGAVRAGQAVRHTFRMQHQGTRPLRITEARSVPDGAEIELPTGPIFADDLVEIAVVVPAEQVEGDFDYAFVLTTDDEVQPQKSLRLTGRVE